MSDSRRSFWILAKLLPTGALGLSIGLAGAVQATTSTGPADGSATSVAARLKAIRSSVSHVMQDAAAECPGDVQLAWWGNGWHRGWPNGWHNWGNGIAPFWGNGGWGNGWHNWGNGWHNGWHNW